MTPYDKSLDNCASMTQDSCSEKWSSHWGHICTGRESFLKSILHCDAIFNTKWFFVIKLHLSLYLTKFPACSFTLTFELFRPLRVSGDPRSPPQFGGAPVVWLSSSGLSIWTETPAIVFLSGLEPRTAPRLYGDCLWGPLFEGPGSGPAICWEFRLLI